MTEQQLGAAYILGGLVGFCGAVLLIYIIVRCILKVSIYFNRSVLSSFSATEREQIRTEQSCQMRRSQGEEEMSYMLR